MSYEISVHLRDLEDEIIPMWIEEMKKFNMDLEIHPDFSFESHSGFLPFKIIVYDCPNRRLNNIELMSGFELWINDYAHPTVKRAFWTSLFSNNKEEKSNLFEKKLKESKKELIFKASTQDSFEYRLAWYAAASLSFICNGLLTDLYQGNQIDSQQVIRHAYDQVISDENSIPEEEWRIHEFKEWLG